MNAGEAYVEARRLQAAGGEPAAVFEQVSVAAAAGDRAALWALSRYYRDGYGVAADPDQARQWLALASGPGRSARQYELALLYLHGRGVEQDSPTAVFWLEQAANRGHTGAQVLLAGLLQRGDGTPSDADAAQRWLITAARRGSDEARYRLALQLGLPAGEPWLRAAADAGHATAQRVLGVHLARGGALATDEAAARSWLERAADNGDVTAMLLVGLFQMQGRGGDVDAERAYYWLSRAELSGEPSATEYRRLLESELELGSRVTATTAAVSRQLPEPIPLRQDGRVLPVDRVLGHGTGFFIDAAGHLLTNQHVVDVCAQVRLPDGRVLDYVAGVPENDIALLAAPDGTSAWLGIAAAPPPVQQSVSVPLVDGRPLQARITAHESPGFDGRHLRFDARLEPGASGTPLIDSDGRVAGLTVAKLTPGAAYEATGVAGEPAAFALRPELIHGFLALYGVRSEGGQGQPAQAVTRLECWY